MGRITIEDDTFIGVIDEPDAAAVLAERLRQLVLGGDLSPGDVLPSERALMADTGLTRATVREGLRKLEIDSLVTPRLGRYGGWTVRRPGRELVTRSIDGFIRGTQVHLPDLLATREAIEPSCAALAAENRTDDDLAALDECGALLRANIDDLGEYLQLNLRWHLTVVDATHNELLIAIMAALSSAVYDGTEIEHVNSLPVRHEVARAHDAVVEAIRAGDADAARRRMHRHVHAFRERAVGPEPEPAPGP